MSIISNGSICNEDMSVITDWTDIDSGTGASTQATFDSKSTMKLASGGTAGASNYAERYQDLGNFGARTVFSMSVYCDAIGSYANKDYLEFFAYDGVIALEIGFSTDGIGVYDDVQGVQEIGTDLVVVDTWQEWTFDVNWTAKTVSVYLGGVLQQANVPCNYSFVDAGYEGIVGWLQNGVTTTNRISYVDWFRAGYIDATINQDASMLSHFDDALTTYSPIFTNNFDTDSEWDVCNDTGITAAWDSSAGEGGGGCIKVTITDNSGALEDFYQQLILNATYGPNVYTATPTVTGQWYEYTMRCKATKAGTVHPGFGNDVNPWGNYWITNDWHQIDVGTDWTTVVMRFQAEFDNPDTPRLSVSFGNLFPDDTILYIDSVSLTRIPTGTDPYAGEMQYAFGATRDTDEKVFGSSSLRTADYGYTSLPSSSRWDLAGNDFTIDFRVKFNSLDGVDGNQDYPIFVARGYDETANTTGWEIYAQPSDDYVAFDWSVTGDAVGEVGFDWTPVVDTWYHFTVVRNGTSLKMYVNGSALTLNYDDGIDTDVIYNNNKTLTIGVDRDANEVANNGDFFDGWIDELRIVKRAVWTANFTPPTEAYTVDNALTLTQQTATIYNGQIITPDLLTLTPALETSDLSYSYIVGEGDLALALWNVVARSDVAPAPDALELTASPEDPTYRSDALLDISTQELELVLEDSTYVSDVLLDVSTLNLAFTDLSPTIIGAWSQVLDTPGAWTVSTDPSSTWTLVPQTTGTWS